MRKIIYVLGILITGLLSLPMFSQIENELVALGLPGDNLNLYAILDVFQKSPTLESFERAINDRDSHFNNLDLNNDNAIDYIEVVSNRKGNSFSVVLRVAVNGNEYQDVAVIEGYKNKDGKVIVQIIGDVELYGENYVVEPSRSEIPNPGYMVNRKIFINRYAIGVYYVNDWPIVMSLFLPTFSVYISPWHWGFYPSYWSPWSPIYYHVYWDFHSHYYHNNYYRRWGYVRYPVNHTYYYTNRRKSSPVVRQNRLEGRYDRVYDGRNYKRPNVPEARRISPTKRYESPSIRRSQSRSEIPSGTRQPMKQAVPSAPQTHPRPQIPSGTRQPIKQAVPSAPQTQPRPQTPSGARQPMKQAVPSAPRPSTRPETHSTARPSSRPTVSPSRSVRRANPDKKNQ